MANANLSKWNCCSLERIKVMCGLELGQLFSGGASDWVVRGIKENVADILCRRGERLLAVADN